MKKSLFLFVTIFTLIRLAAEPLNYSLPENWLIREPEKNGTTYDLFYLYPTLSNKKRIFLDRNDEKIMKKVLDFVRAQTGIFAGDARIFAPFVRQLEYEQILAHINSGNDSNFLVGVEDAQAAFLFYRRNFQQGRPVIFLGHSQGAMELYELLKREKSISTGNGFAAAFLIGLPGYTVNRIRGDFQGREIRPAQAADDLGVIIIWNTMNREAKNSMFIRENGFCINPLNWKTDASPAGPEANRGARFYDYRNGSTESIPHFCGAYIDPEKGALIVDLPSNSRWDAKGMMGIGIFHMNDIWFFAENLKENMHLRAATFLKQTGAAK